MNLSMMVYDNNGATRGQLRMKLDFSDTTWSLAGDSGQVWPRLGGSQSGPMDVKGTQVAIKAQPPGKLPGVVLLLSNLPESGAANAGTGKIVTATDQALSDGFVYWACEDPGLSPVRQAMQAVLKEWIPVPVISSDDAAFKKLTGFTTQRLLDEYWEPENRNPPWPDGKKPPKNTTFTTCNLTLGALAGKLGQKLGKRVGRWLGAGVLQLDWANRDVPGSWIPSTSGLKPQAGDFYSKPDGAQVFGHVGTIAEITEQGVWFSADGGQGGYISANKKDYIKRVNRGKLEPATFNGWVDIDKYFA